MKRVSRGKRVSYVAAVCSVLGAVLLVASCGTERPNASNNTSSGTIQPGNNACLTPNEGCECLEPGKIVECGQVKSTSADGFVACEMGHRQCIGGSWGACIGETQVTKKTFVAAGGPQGPNTLALGAGAPCGAAGGGPANPCDPYCNAFVDDPIGLVLDGGLVVSDGGLTIPPTTTGDASVPGAFVSTAAGLSNCGGANNIVAPSCTPPGLTQCQQDFRCDTYTNRCLWNGGPGYYSRTAGGVDLTVGAPCGTSGSGAAIAPVCNRGDVALAAGATITFHVTTGATPPDACTNLGAPTFTFTTTAALAPGACMSFNLGNSAGNKIITINAGAPGAVAEAPGLCANNSAGFKDDGAPGCGECALCDTRVTGKVFDPSGVPPDTNANNIPLAGITVYQPSAPLTTFSNGVSCDSCDALSTPSQAETVTAADGSFTLVNVSPGPNVPIYVQTGRWRRGVTVNVPACATTSLTNGTLRLPRSRTDSPFGTADIPKTAMVTGNQESLQCWLRRIGVDASEMQRRVGPSDANRIQLYRDNGMNTAPGMPSVSTLYANPAQMAEYTSLVLDCEGGSGAGAISSGANATVRQRIVDYANLGGKVFMDHWPGESFIRYAPAATNWPGRATWVAGASSGVTTKGRINTGTPPQDLFRDWLQAVGASTDYGTGTVRVDQPRRNATGVAAGTTEWIRGSVSNPTTWTGAGEYSLSFSFETPVGAADCGTTNGRGRVFFNGMHTSSTRTSGSTFPTNCNLGPLSPEEKALEYQFFQLTACQLGGSTPPTPPPPPPPLVAVSFQRDYYATCNVGERVKWGPIYWQSIIPPGTQIEFRAATASTLGALPPSPAGPAPATAAVAMASATVLPPTWDCNGCPGTPVSVDSQLVAQTGQPSAEYLRVYMKFVPTPLLPPTLLAWRQIYDCVPAE